MLHRLGASPPLGVSWLDTSGDNPVLVRVSRGGGLPSPLPDVLGLAVRVDPDGPRPGDLLFATTGSGRFTRFLLAPTWRTTTPMSTLMPFRTSAGPVVLGARRTGVDRFELRCATLTGPWRRFATVRLETGLDTVPEGEQLDVAFDPVLHQLPGLESYDWARRLREPSYAAARTGRPTDHGSATP